MTLTVRLDTATESALERYCTERGVTKSLVVQESLAVYLLGKAAVPAAKGAKVSANYKAFAEAGFIGAYKGDGVSATNAVIRERAMQRIRRKAV
jgi:hypothetical protein